MARSSRVHYPGAPYHAMSRGNGGENIFEDHADYYAFLKHLAFIKAELGFELYSFCLMPNHFHLLVRVDSVPLDRLMQLLLTRYAAWFNWRRKRKGHVFQSRYKALLCADDRYLTTVIRYIHLNPVEAGIVTEPKLWPWSSHAQYLTNGAGLADTSFPLSLFGKDPATSRQGYLELMGSAAPSEAPPRFEVGPRRRFPKSSLDPGYRLEDIAHAECKKARVPLKMLMGRSLIKIVVRARTAFIVAAAAAGHRPVRIAEFLHRSPSAISKIYARYYRLSTSDTIAAEA